MMHRLRTLACPLTLAVSVWVAIAVSNSAQASLVMALDLPTLVGRADHIAVAEVVSVQAAWDKAHERIESTIELRVVEAWKGPTAPAARLTIVQPGGTVGDLQMVVFGFAHFKAGERSLLFLRGPVTAANVVGMSQGKRPLRRDQPTGRWMVEGHDSAGALYVRPPALKTPTTTPVAAGPRSLDDLREEVRGILKARR